MCRLAGQGVKDREAYVVMRDHKLLHKPRLCDAELHQAAKLFELLPHQPNDLWQMDVTYIHIPGYGWWYAVTVIDYYSRYLLACHLTASYSAVETAHALKLCGALGGADPRPAGQKPTVPGDRQRAVVRGAAIRRLCWPRTSTATCASSTARRSNWGCWSDFTPP